MHITFAPRGILQIDDARITYKNFEGRGDKFNREGDRNFSLIIPDEEIMSALVEDKNEHGVGWNVKIKPPREEGDDPFMHLKVKVKFTDFGPNIYLESNGNRVRLDEETVQCLDEMRLARVDLDIRPYDDVVQGKPFRSAYLQGMLAVQDTSGDRFARRFDNYDEE